MMSSTCSCLPWCRACLQAKPSKCSLQLQPSNSLQHSDQTPPVISTRFPPNSSNQILPIPRLIRPFYLLQMRRVPMQLHDPGNQHFILRPHPCHGMLDVDSVPHRPISPASDHLHENVFHMTREFVDKDLFKRPSVSVFVCVGNCTNLRVRALAEDGTDGQLFGAYSSFCTAVDFGDVCFDRLRDHWG